MLKYLKINWLQCCVVIILGLIAALFSVFQGIMLQIIIDNAVGNLDLDFKYIFLLVVLYVGFNYMVMISYKCNLNSVIIRTIEQVKNLMISSVLKDEKIESENSMEFLSTIEKDITQVSDKYYSGFFSIIHMGILFILSLMYLLLINKTLTIVVLISGFISVFLPQIFVAKARKINESYLIMNKKFFYLIKELIGGLSVTKIFGLEKKINSKVHNANSQLESLHKKQLYQQSLIESLSNCIGFLILASNVVFAGYLSSLGYFTIGTVLAIMQIMNFIMMPLVQIPINIMQIKSVKPAVDNINKYILSSIVEEEDQFDVSDDIKYIELYNLCYKPKNQDQYILKNINCKFIKGKKYVIVGASGSGKSTLLKIIADFIKEYEGNIIINEKTHLKDYPITVWRKKLAIIEQNVFLFNDTIKYNICFDEIQNETEFNTLIKKVGLQNFIEKRENRIYSIIGESGDKISGGEKQRIAIARCLYKKAPILLADEPTSGLDATNAFLIEKLILSCEQMVIHVTHKLEEEILKQYDQIICLDNGVFAGIGNYNQLICENMYFQKLCSDYRYEGS